MRTPPRWAGVLAVGVFAALLVPAMSSAEDRHSRRSKKKNDTPTAAPDAAPEPPIPPIIARTIPSDGKPIATAYMADDDLGATEATTVLAAFGSALGRDERFHYVDLAELLDPSEAAASAIADADRALEDARAAFDQMDLDTARAKAEAAIATYRKHLPLLGANERGTERLRNAWSRLAAVRFLDGNTDGARDALRHALVFDPQLQYSPRVFPPQMKKTVQEAGLLVEALGAGKLSITSTPSGAAVYVNGVVRGKTPLTIDDAPPGPNEITVVRRGYQVLAAEAEVAGGGEESKAELTLTRAADDPFAPVRAAKAQLGMPIEPEPLVAASQRVKAELMIVVMGAQTGAGQTITAYLYDARPRQLLRKVVRSGPAERLEAVAKDVAAELFRGVRLDGRFVAEVTERKSFLDSKLFWPVVGGAAGLVVAGCAITTGVVVAEQHRQDTIEKVIILLGTSR